MTTPWPRLKNKSINCSRHSPPPLLLRTLLPNRPSSHPTKCSPSHPAKTSQQLLPTPTSLALNCNRGTVLLLMQTAQPVPIPLLSPTKCPSSHLTKCSSSHPTNSSLFPRRSQVSTGGPCCWYKRHSPPYGRRCCLRCCLRRKRLCRRPLRRHV